MLVSVIGIVECMSPGKATIRFMKRSGRNFMWPSKPDIQDVLVSEILCRISGKPVAVSKTRFNFEASDSVDVILENLGDDCLTNCQRYQYLCICAAHDTNLPSKLTN